MKTLKKILSLVLVVAMIASMMIVGAAAATEETTKYEEAVAVVTGLGIIEGDENGYNFTGNLTREQAAKIIAYMLLGKDTAEALKTTTAPFADVAASRWSAGYIAYLKGQGIISGVSDTEFDPTANVTGIAFAKMLLTAIGYGKAGEFEGADWDINTITFANQSDIYEGTLAADLAAAATREEAMLYLFNALLVPTVKYNKTFEAYYTGNSPLQEVENPDLYTLGWLNYELQLVPGADTDDFGRPAANWNADGVDIAVAVSTAAPDAVLYGSVKSAALYEALGKTVAEAVNKDDDWSEITVWTNGVADTESPLVTGPIKAGYTTNAVSTYGATVEIYVEYVDGAYDIDIVVWYEMIGTVTRVGKTANTITVVGTTTETISGEDFDITGYAKDDVVIYTKGATSVATLKKAEPVVGTLINHTLFTWNIDGVTVYANPMAVSTPAEYGVSYEVYYDAQGNILKAVEYDSTEASGAYQYIYVQGSQAQIKSTDLLGNNATKVAYDVVNANGGQSVVYGAVKTDATGDYVMVNGEKKYITEDVASEFVPAGWYSFTANDAGEIAIKDLSRNSYAEAAGYVAVAEGKANTGITVDGTTYSANSKTVLNVVDEDGNVATYTGIANFPEAGKVAGAYSVLVTHAANSSVAKTINVYVGGDTITGATKYAYVVMAWSYDAETVTFMAWVDGAMQFLTTARAGYNEYTMFTVCELEVVDGENVFTPDYTLVNNFGKYKYDANTSVQQWYEEATIDVVDDNFFTTVAVADDEDAIADSIRGGAVESYTYYYDGNTVIYDCVNGGFATELSSGDCFIAVMDDTDPTLCAYIWIVA